MKFCEKIRRHGEDSRARSEFRREASAERILATAAGIDEVEEVFLAARLGPAAGHPKAAEGLAADEGAGDAPVDVEVADAEVALGLLDMGGFAGEDAAGEL